MDIVVESLEGQPMILYPEGASRNHWIGFELARTRNNRLALNARMRVTSGALVQTDEVRSGGSYLSQNDLGLHFGPGSHATAEKVGVLWPSGHIDKLDHVGADRSYCMQEGDGIVPCSNIRPRIPR